MSTKLATKTVPKRQPRTTTLRTRPTIGPTPTTSTPTQQELNPSQTSTTRKVPRQGATAAPSLAPAGSTLSLTKQRTNSIFLPQMTVWPGRKRSRTHPPPDCPSVDSSSNKALSKQQVRIIARRRHRDRRPSSGALRWAAEVHPRYHHPSPRNISQCNSRLKV